MLFENKLIGMFNARHNIAIHNVHVFIIEGRIDKINKKLDNTHHLFKTSNNDALMIAIETISYKLTTIEHTLYMCNLRVHANIENKHYTKIRSHIDTLKSVVKYNADSNVGRHYKQTKTMHLVYIDNLLPKHIISNIAHYMPGPTASIKTVI